jgi:alanine racemase
MRYLAESRIDLGAMRYNLEQIRAHVGPDVAVMAIVKADAYGHGASVVAPFLERQGVDVFAVGHVFEAKAVREAGVTGRIVVLQPDYYLDRESFSRFDLECVINGEADLEPWQSGPRVPAHLFVDTGMGREGVMPSGFEHCLDKLINHPVLHLTGIATHFACADHADLSNAREQLDQFEELLERVPHEVRARVQVHAANTGATLNLPESHYDMVRPGIWLYGQYPGAGHCIQRPVMSVHGRLMTVKAVPKGTRVGYGGTYTIPEHTRVGLVSVGYADGYPRAKSGKSSVWIRGKAYPVIGLVSMDMISVDLGLRGEVEEGDDVLVFGGEPNEPSSLFQDAASLGSITFERCCQLGMRLPRVYINRETRETPAAMLAGRAETSG